MSIIEGIVFFLAELITVLIFIWVFYIYIRWIAENLVEPAFTWLNGKMLMFYVYHETEQWLMWQKWRDKNERSGP